MFDAPYPFCNVGSASTTSKNPYKKIFYKFYARKRTYLVTFECYAFEVVAVKFCDVKDKRSKKAYHRIFDDGDAFRVIGTCFYIMLAYWRKNPNVNFVFYASLRDITEELLSKKTLALEQVPSFIANYQKTRYRIYRYGMVNLFSYEYFTAYSDRENCVYALINNPEHRQSFCNHK